MAKNNKQRPFWKKKRWWLLIGAPICLFAFLFFYVQGSKIIPRYSFHPFHEVEVVQSGDDVHKTFQDLSFFARLRYAYALAKFPDAQSCLIGTQETLATNSELNWDVIKTQTQAMICLFNIAHEFKDRNQFRRWLERRALFIDDGRAGYDLYNYSKVEISLEGHDGAFLWTITPEVESRNCMLHLYHCVLHLNQRHFFAVDDQGVVKKIVSIKPKLSL